MQGQVKKQGEQTRVKRVGEGAQWMGTESRVGVGWGRQQCGQGCL